MQSDELYRQADEEARRITGTAARYGKKILGKVAKKVALKTLKVLFLILKMTAPVWVPLVLILVLAFGTHMLLYGFAKEATDGGPPDKKTVIAAFFGVLEDEVTEANERLFDEYKKLAAKWSQGLSKEQKEQVVAHALPWSVLLATDRVVNDAAVWEGKENVTLQPLQVFEALRPRFKWKESEVITTTVTYTDKGTVTSTSTRKVTLVTEADTFEGHFDYVYEWQTEIVERSSSGYVSVKKEVLKEVKPPAEYYIPWKQYLSKTRGIEDQLTIDHLQELAILYDEDYQFSHALTVGLDYSTYPVIEGSNGWIWPTPSTRITSPFGPRAYPRPGFHHGIDIGAVNRGVSGDPVYCIDDGEVLEAGFSVIYGRYVIVKHAKDVFTCYAHLDQRKVKEYQKIKKGDLIGTMGSTGFSTGVHLHFEIRQGKRPLDPRFYFPQIFSSERSVGVEVE
jgi:murein DD-endopeptidase MepM/ murein hydrolase activator NlpD